MYDKMPAEQTAIHAVSWSKHHAGILVPQESPTVLCISACGDQAYSMARYYLYVHADIQAQLEDDTVKLTRCCL